MMRDIKDNLDAVQTIAPLSAVRATGTATGAAVDLQGYDAAVALFSVGAWTDGTHTPSLQDSPDGTTYTAVPSSNMQGTFTAVGGTTQNNTMQRVGYIGSNRYLRGMLVGAGVTTGVPTDMTVVRSSAKVKPLA